MSLRDRFHDTVWRLAFGVICLFLPHGNYLSGMKLNAFLSRKTGMVQNPVEQDGIEGSLPTSLSGGAG